MLTKALSSLFVNKCRTQMNRSTLLLFAESQQKTLLKKCFSTLKQKWSIGQFVVKKESELVARILY